MELKSTLESVIQQAWAERNLDLAKSLVVDHFKQSKVKDEDKNRMIREITNQPTKYKFDYYLSNALLKFEGHGVSQLTKKQK